MPPERLQDGAMVSVEYRISFHESQPSSYDADQAWASGLELDSSRRRGHNLTFELGAKMVLSAIDHVVRTMIEGETKTVLVQAKDAADPVRCKELGVRESQQLCCAIRMISSQNERADLKQEAELRYQQALRAKDSGNAQFKLKNPKAALHWYRLGRKKLDGFAKAKLDREDYDRCRALLVSLLINSAACSLQLGESQADQTIKICSKALALDGKSVKAFYRRAMAHNLLGNTEASVADLKSALRLEPTNEDVMKEILKLGDAAFAD